MLLEIMMEDKQLNLTRPLLSVRRHSSTMAVENDGKRNGRSFLPSIPRPPPYKSELKSGPVTNPGTVPFQWEQSPGRPKDERTPETHIVGPPVAPKLPPGRILLANEQDNDNTSASRGIECSNNIMEKAEEKNTDSGEENEVYEDALDTLSRTESFFLNCSMSGISGLDDSGVKSSGTFFADPQAKEFMINRFLPAAKAMISETPEYAPSKKQPIVEDNARQLKKVANGDKQPQLRYGPTFAKHYSESQHDDEEESVDEYDGNENFHQKACGLLPKFCLKSSLCLLNPLFGMSMRTRVPMSPARRIQARSSSASTFSKTENELSSFDASEQRSIYGSQTAELLEDKNDMRNKSNEILSKDTAESKDAGDDNFSSHGKRHRSFRDLLADENISDETDSGGAAVEKTLYIDAVHKGESLEQKPYSFDSTGLINLSENDDEVSKKMVQTNVTDDSSFVKKLSSVDGGEALKTDPKSLDLSFPPLASEHNQNVENDAPKNFREDENHYEDAVDSKVSEVPIKEATQSLGKHNPKAEKVEIFPRIYSEFLVPPPLPKSPSDSWLCRTLPSMSLKNSSRQSHFGTGINARTQSPKIQSWETIVRTSKVHHHLRYSEELLARIPES